jgi:tetratricopeptide (TPR) repeat protein
MGRYEVHRVLCRGTTPLLEATDTVLDRPVIIRTLAHSLAVDPERRGRFVDAALLAARLTHPQIASILDLGDDSHGDPYVVMEQPEGQSLRAIMDEPQARSVSLRVDVVMQLCEAVGHAHDHGVNQLGLRPPGIFVTDQGRVTVAPFGIVPIHGSRGTLAALVFEEIAYLAPEHVEGRVPDRRADVFGLGVIAYELMARRRPFQGATIPALLNAILNDAPDMSALERTAYTPHLEDVIRKALARDPDERYSEAEAILLDLEALVCESAPQAPPADGVPADVVGLHAELQRCLTERRWEPALALCRRVRAAAPDDAAAVRGETLALEGRRQEAEEFRAAALFYAADGRFAEAQALVGPIEARDPGDPRNALLRVYLRNEGAVEGLLETARRYMELGDFLEARTAAEGALALSPSRSRAQALLRRIEEILTSPGAASRAHLARGA